MSAPAANEMRRPVAVAALADTGTDVDLAPNAAEREAISRRLDIVGLVSLDGRIRVEPHMGRQVTATGAVSAVVRQTCVATGETIENRVDFTLERRYADPADIDAAAADDDDLHDPDAEEIDPIVDGVIDVGEAVIEELALGLDPYPRRADAAYVEVRAGPSDAEIAERNPFAALAALKKNLKSND